MGVRDVPARIAWAAERCAALPARRFLEVGCGPGHAVAALCASRPDAEVTAIDRSARQVEAARARNRAAIAAGRARVELLALERAPAVLGPGSAEAALAVNVNDFWRRDAALTSLRALLAPGGRVLLVYEPPSAAQTPVLRRRLTPALVAHGFHVEWARETELGAGRGLGILARVDDG